MVVYAKGGDPEAMAAAASRFADYAASADAVGTAVDTAVGTTGRTWAGPDLSRFVADWRRQRPGVDALVAALRTAGEALRRNAAAQRAASAGIPSGPSGPSGPGPALPVDQQLVDGLIADVKKLDGADFGANGSRDELTALAQRLRGMNAAELDAFLKGLSDDDLRRLGTLFGDQSGPMLQPWNTNGLTTWDRLDVSGDLMSRVSPTQLARLTTAFGWNHPGMTDAAGSVGAAYGTPKGPLFDGPPPPDLYNQIRQGQVGSCWMLSSLIAAARDNPTFVSEGVRANPNGTVSVRLFDSGGQPHWITMDDQVPMVGGSPYGAHGPLDANGVGVTWPAYYEKAMAMAYQDDFGHWDMGWRHEQGSYAAMEGEFQWSGARYLTGRGAQSLTGLDTWGNVAQAVNGDHKQVLVGTPPDLPFSQGPPGWHSQHIFYVKSVSDTQIVLGNPWGPNYPDVVVTDPAQFQRWFLAPVAIDTPAPPPSGFDPGARPGAGVGGSSGGSW